MAVPSAILSHDQSIDADPPPGTPGWFAACRAHPVLVYGNGLVLLLVLAFGIYVIGQSALHPVDRDESRFAQASRQMFEAAALPAAQLDLRRDEAGRPLGLHAGGWAVPMFGETPRLNKPPLIYWLQAASAWVFTGGDPAKDAIWMYRVPSAACAVLSAGMLLFLGRAMFAGFVGSCAMVLLAVSPMMIWDGHQARSDQLLTFTTLLMMAALWSIWSKRDHAPHLASDLCRAALFWLALGLGILSKGPITPMIAILTTLTLALIGDGQRTTWRWLIRLHPLLGVIILSLVLAPWLLAIDHTFGLRQYWAIVYDEFFVRGTTGSREGHLAPPGFHLLLAGVLLWPGSLVLIDAIKAAWRGRAREGAATLPAQRPRGWRHFLPAPGRDAERFLIAWIIPAWIVFELSPAKLPHYVMPLYPAACLLCARLLISRDYAARRREHLGTADPRRPLNFGERLWLVIAMVPAFACLTGAALAFAGQIPGLSIAEGVSLTAVGLLALCVCIPGLTALRNRRVEGTLFTGITAAFFVTAFILTILAPSILPGAQTARLFDPLIKQRPDLFTSAPHTPFASVYHEDSVVFWSRGTAQRLHTVAIPAWLKANSAGAAIIDERQLSEAQALGFRSIAHMPGENSTMPKGQRDTTLHIVLGPQIPDPPRAHSPAQ